MQDKVTRLQAIMLYFSTGDRKVTSGEVRALTVEDREELGPLCQEALGYGPDGKPMAIAA